jgi:RES domain-containing protein
MEVFRLTSQQFANSLSGKGAAIKGARWNSIGVEVLYTAANRSLAMAEVAVHFTLATLPKNFMMVTIHIPDEIEIYKLENSKLPANWNAFPYSQSTQQIGEQFIAENKYCVMQILSVITKGDYNMLINPKHPHFETIKIIEIEKFPFDKRVFASRVDAFGC